MRLDFRTYRGRSLGRGGHPHRGDKYACDENWETRNALSLLWTFETGDKACSWGTDQPHHQIVPGQLDIHTQK